MGFFSTPNEYAIQGETSPPPKLDTLFLFRNYGTDFYAIQSEFSKSLDKGAHRLKSLGCKISGNFHQVTEFQPLQKHDVNDLDLDIFIKNARFRNGIPSFGQSPPPDTTKVVFQVRRTFLTFDRSKYELLMPILGSCFYVCGEDLRFFPGPRFPMTHLLYGAGCEMISGSEHQLVGDARLKFNAEFKQASWFHQKAYHRIVLPRMLVSDFLSLKLQVSGLRNDKRLAELFVISEISIELQEFVSVHEQGHFFKEVKTEVLFKKAPFCTVVLSKTPLDICPDIALPDLGPSFFTKDLTRSYGLRISVKVSHKSLPSVSASTFMELNVAQETQERINYKALDDQEYYGSSSTARTLLFQDSRTEGYLEAFKKKFQITLFENRKSFLLCLVQSHTNGSSSYVYGSVDGREPALAKKEEVCFSNYVFDFIQKVKSISRLFTAQVPKPHSIRALVTERPISGGDVSNTSEPYASTCLTIGNQAVEAVDQNSRWLRATRDKVLTIGTAKVPLSLRLVLNDRFKLSGGFGDSVIATPGMKLSDLLKFQFILPLSFETLASGEVLVEDLKIRVRRLVVILNELDGHIKTTTLTDQRGLPLVHWNNFRYPVAGNPTACAFHLPEELIEGKIPNRLESISQDSGYLSSFCLIVVLLVDKGEKAYFWPMRLVIADP